MCVERRCRCAGPYLLADRGADRVAPPLTQFIQVHFSPLVRRGTRHRVAPSFAEAETQILWLQAQRGLGGQCKRKSLSQQRGGPEPDPRDWRESPRPRNTINAGEQSTVVLSLCGRNLVQECALFPVPGASQTPRRHWGRDWDTHLGSA